MTVWYVIITKGVAENKIKEDDMNNKARSKEARYPHTIFMSEKEK